MWHWSADTYFDSCQLIITWMSNIKFKHNLYVLWTFKLVSKTFHINLHEEVDVKFLGCIDNQLFLAMKLRHVDPPAPAPTPLLWCRVWRRMTFQTIRYEVLRFGTKRSGVIVRCSCYGADRAVLRRGSIASFVWLCINLKIHVKELPNRFHWMITL